MRKKDINGNYVKRPEARYTSVIKKIGGQHPGHSSLIYFLEGTSKLIINENSIDLCLSDDGYK